MTGEHTRRRVLELTGAAAAGVAGLAGQASAQAQEDGWTLAESPVCTQLNGAVQTTDGQYAVGENGTVIARGDDGAWEIVVDRGPRGEESDLLGADVSAAGGRLWFAGASGAVGEYDVNAGALTDHSAPRDGTSTWTDVAVTGPGGERIHLVNDSGQELTGIRQSDGSVEWGEPTTPGEGSSIEGADFRRPRAGVLAGSDGAVFETTDGETYEEVGVEDAWETFYGVATESDDDIDVAAGSGTLYHYDGSGWVRLDVGQNDVRAVDRSVERGAAVAGGGVIFEREPAEEWTRTETPTGNTLRGVSLGGTSPDVAVGVGGVILERSG